MSRQRHKKGLGSRFKGVPCIKVGGVYCYCCNPYNGRAKALPGRTVRRAEKQALVAAREDEL